jgi:hypothetical protein
MLYKVAWIQHHLRGWGLGGPTYWLCLTYSSQALSPESLIPYVWREQARVCVLITHSRWLWFGGLWITLRKILILMYLLSTFRVSYWSPFLPWKGSCFQEWTGNEGTLGTDECPLVVKHERSGALPTGCLFHTIIASFSRVLFNQHYWGANTESVWHTTPLTETRLLGTYSSRWLLTCFCPLIQRFISEWKVELSKFHVLQLFICDNVWLLYTGVMRMRWPLTTVPDTW